MRVVLYRRVLVNKVGFSSCCCSKPVVAYYGPDPNSTKEFALVFGSIKGGLVGLCVCQVRRQAHTAVSTLPGGNQGDIVQELSSQLQTQLSAHHLVLPDAPGSSNDSSTLWFDRPWILLESSRRKSVYTFTQHAKAKANNFNQKFIIDMNVKFVNPDAETRGIPLVTLGVRYGPVKGPLPNSLSAAALMDAVQFNEPHSCLRQRILYRLPHSGHDYDAQCLGACPDESVSPSMMERPISPFVPVPLGPRRARTPAAMVASSSRTQIRARSPQSPSPPHTRRRTEPSVLIEVISSDDEDFIPQPLLPPRRVPLPRAVRAPVLPPPPAQITLATGAAIEDWQRSIWIEVPAVPEGATVHISGNNITAMAEFIIAVFIQLRCKELRLTSSFPRPADIHRPSIDVTHRSFLQAMPYRVYAVYHFGSVGRGVEYAVWRNVLELVAAERQFWCPTMVEPEHATFVLAPVSTPDRAAQFYAHGQLIALHMYYYGHGLSSLVSPTIADELRSWFALRSEDPMPTALTAPVCRLIMDTLDIQPSLIPSVRTSAQHDDITVKLMSQQRGFSHVQSLADDVLPHLRFTVLAQQTSAPLLTTLCSLFEMRFKCYLAGHGHSRWLMEHGLVSTEEEMARGNTVPFIRAQLLLLTALESSLLPVAANWTIRFTVSVTPPQAGIECTSPLPLCFHTCSGGIDVQVNEKLISLMVYSPQGEEDTEFDIWVHTQIYNADLARTSHENHSLCVIAQTCVKIMLSKTVSGKHTRQLYILAAELEKPETGEKDV
ncbi:hypothetical protein B0H16DRAFT_1469571 [Mycena metata]|uniref:Uncharacterized protein n=1 Tax=Mycena metata TaxID=1033252 RepID=A0AAD7HYT7_9AGAR|nr:hypothetical protein B0H16DRAFT_1469571 [Mycena metata]